MSFETATTYRSADRVHAVRLTTEGNIPITHSEDGWLRRLIAFGQLVYRGKDLGFYVLARPSNLGGSIAGHGDWVVWHDRSDVAEALNDAMFRERYEASEEE